MTIEDVLPYLWENGSEHIERINRGVLCICYADDIVLPANSRRASERLLESGTRYLEGKLKLTVNREKSRRVSVFAARNFKSPGISQKHKIKYNKNIK